MINPKDKEWYEDEEWAYPGNAEYDIPKIVAEAERRGREAAWEEVKALINGMIRYQGIISLNDGEFITRAHVLQAIDTKLTELKKV